MNDGDGGPWLVCVGWDELIHPDARRSTSALPWHKAPAWIMRRDEYMDLSEHRALILHRLWLEYASSSARLRLDTRSISRRLGLRVTTADIEALIQAGFVAISASRLQAERLHDASLARAIEDKSRTEESPLPTTEPLPQPEAKRPARGGGGGSGQEEERQGLQNGQRPNLEADDSMSTLASELERAPWGEEG